MADRHQFHAKWHDYDDGIYFVTLCCADHRHFFGEISDGKISLSPVGMIADTCLTAIPDHSSYTDLINHIVMPNHIHMIIGIRQPVGTRHVASAQKKGDFVDRLGCLNGRRHDTPDSQDFHHNSRLALVVGQFKAAVTRKSKLIDPAFGWQARYQEHIIRDARAFDNIMEYISNNIQRWDTDCYR